MRARARLLSSSVLDMLTKSASLRLGSAVLLSLACGAAQAQQGEAACGNPFQNHYGPFDYRTASKETRALVEDYHFTLGVETMTKPKNTMMHDMAQDVSYTLGVFPNHPRALVTMTRLSEKYKSDPPPGTSRSVECWFDRAVRFRPDDTVARVLYARFLASRSRVPEALSQMQTATSHAKDNPISHYNIGLVYFEMRQFDLALQQAHKALKLGYPRPELAEQLKSVNKWVEPTPD